MNVLMSADAVGGVWTYAIDLSRALAARGARVTLAVMGPSPSDAQRAEAAEVPGLALRDAPYRLEWMQDPWRDVERAGEWLLRLERESGADVVHLNGYAHAALPWRAPVAVVAHSCVLGWWEAVHGEPAPPEWDRYRDAAARGLDAADLVVAPTQAMLDSLERHHGALSATTLVVPNGRDASGFAPARKESFVLAVGRAWDPGKDVATLDAAAAGAPWPLHVVGDARHPETGALARLHHAHAEGRVDAAALARWYARATVYASAARYEPFGLGALEAAFSGCALLLSDLPSLREVWGDAALYAPPGDADAFRDGLTRLAHEPFFRARLAADAAARAARHTPDAMADSYLAAYARLSDAFRSPAPQEKPPCAS